MLDLTTPNREDNGIEPATGRFGSAKGTQIARPRGPVTINAGSGDIVQNIYMRKVERIDGELYNNEFKTYEAVKDPAR